MTYTVTTGQAGVTATVDDNGLVHVAVPANFNGIFNVTVTAVEAGDIADRPPTTATVAIYSLQGSQTWVNTVTSTGTAVSPSAAVLSGNNLFVCAGTDGLIVYNVANPNNVTVLGSYVYKVSSTAQYTRDIQLSADGNTAFIVATNASSYGAGGGLIALDVSNPASIRLLDSVSSQPLNAAAAINAVNLTIRDDIAFVAGYTDGLWVFNVADPSNITPVYNQPISRPYPTVQIYYAWDVATKDNAVYIADPAGQIVVLTIDARNILSYARDILTKGHPLSLYTYGNFLYVADETNGLMTYDITNASKPKLISRFATDGSAFSVSVMNQTAIVTTGTGYEVINVANPKKPVEVSTFVASGNGRANFVGNQFTVPFSESGVTLTDATDFLHTIVVPDKVPVSFRDQDGHLVTVTASMCSVRITTSGVGGGVMDRIEVIPTSDKATVKITVAGGRATAGDIVVNSNIVSFSAPMVDVTGDVDFKGTISGVTLGNMGPDSTLDLEKAGKPVKLQLDQVTDLSLTSAAPLTSLTVSSWTDSDGAVDITAPSIAKLTSKGSFQGDMSLSGVGATKSVLGAATITGSLDGAHWDITGAMGNLTVTETALDSSIRTTGNMGKLSMATADGSDFLAGVNGNVARHATAASDFTNVLASIAGVKITGVKGGLATDTYLKDSNFTAASIGASTVVNALADNLGVSFGFWARANGGKEFKSVKVTDLQSRQTWSWTALGGLHLGDLLAESL